MTKVEMAVAINDRLETGSKEIFPTEREMLSQTCLWFRNMMILCGALFVMLFSDLVLNPSPAAGNHMAAVITIAALVVTLLYLIADLHLRAKRLQTFKETVMDIRVTTSVMVMNSPMSSIRLDRLFGRPGKPGK